MKALVIGGSGFIGGAIVNELLHRNWDVDIADRHNMDISDYNSVKNVIGHPQSSSNAWGYSKYDHVYNMAGVLGTTELNSEIVRSIEINTIGAVNVMAACADYGVQALFYPSKPNPWLNMYTITKEASEKIGRLFVKEDRLKVVSLRYFNVFGAKQHTHPVRKILPTFALCGKLGLPMPIFGDGNSIVDMCDIESTARFTVDAMEVLDGTEVYDLGTGIGRRVNEVADDVLNIFDSDAGRSHQPMRDGEDERTILVADTEGLSKHLRLDWADYYRELEKACQYYDNMSDKEAREALAHHGLHATLLP
jgi:UDP-glucose 4-epimerase